MASLRDLSREEFSRVVQSVAGSDTAALASATSATEPFPLQPQEPDVEAPGLVAPRTEAALAESGGSNFNLFTPPTARQGAREGVALDRETGLPFTRQLALELRRRPIDKFNELKQHYGAVNVEVAPDGNFVVRNQVNPDTGRAEDLVVKRGGINRATFVAALPEIVFGAIGQKLGLKGASKLTNSRTLRTIGSLLGMATVGQSAGAIKDTAVRLFDGDPVEVDEIVKARARDAGFDFAFGAALGSAVKLGTKALSPLSSSGAAQLEERAAVAALEDLAGETMPRTPGEMASGGSMGKVLLRVEAQFAKRPGSSAAFEAVETAKDTFIRRLQNRFLGIPVKTPPSEVAGLLPGQEATGQRALGTLGSQALALEGNVAKAGQAVELAGTAEAQALARVSISSRIDPTSLGGVQRRVVTRSFDAFKAKAAADYNAFLGKPEISERLVPTGALASDAAALARAMPDVQLTKKLPGFDAYGNPTEVAKEIIERLDTFVAPRVRVITDKLATLEDGKTSIASLKQIRTAIDDGIAEGVSIPGTDVKQLYGLRETVNKAIRDGLQGLPDGANLLKEWDTLNASYRTGMSRFDRTSIRQILVKPGESGAIMDTAIVERTFGNSAGAKDVYDEYAKFFGKQSVEFRSLQLAIAEDALGAGALKPGTSTIDGKRLLANLNGMRREVADEILGVNQAELRRIGEALGAAQGKLDVNELAQLAKSRTLTAEKLTELISAEGTRATAYKNRLLAASAKGALSTERIQPADFVRYMANTASTPEVVEVLGRLQGQPELLQSIRTLAAEEFLSHAGVGIKLSPAAITRTAGDRARQDVWRALLGDETHDALKNFAIALRPTEAAVQTLRATGGQQAGQELSSVFGRGELEAIPGILTRGIVAFIYAGPGRLLANNLVTPADAHRFVNGVVASEPFLSYLTERFGTKDAEAAIDALRPAFDAAYQRDAVLRGEQPLAPGQRLNLRNMSKEEFKAYVERAGQ